MDVILVVVVARLSSIAFRPTTHTYEHAHTHEFAHTQTSTVTCNGAGNPQTQTAR